MKLIDADALQTALIGEAWYDNRDEDIAYQVVEDAKQPWVSVTDRLPKNCSIVLAYIKHNYSDTDGWRAYRVYEYTDHWIGVGNLCEVIAWMPLPKPPEAKGE